MRKSIRPYESRRRFASFTLIVVLLTTFFFQAQFFHNVAQADTGTGTVTLTTAGSPSTQNFDTLSNTAGSTTNTTLPTGWYITETGGGARDNELYAVDTGGSNTGDTYSYGAAGNTERALGGLQSGTLIPVFGASFTNNTGSTISSLDVAYFGEQWRIGNTAAARDDRLDFQFSTNATSLTTGTWTDVNALDFTNPVKTAASAGALDGNLAANRTAVSSTISGLGIANGATFWIRWNDLNASGADDGLAVDDFSITPNPTVTTTPNLSINDVSLFEGNSGTTTFNFIVNLSAPAGPGGVTFDIATADGTAQDGNPPGEDNDYVANNLTGQTIPAGSSSYSFNVTVNGDTTVEPNETFFVNVINVVGANVVDGQGLGTIINDDVTLVPIHDIQGPGASSPIVGSSVTTRGIVTGVKNNGFFIQETDALVDADPATSEGVFVFTSSAPTAAATVGNLVQVTGTVTEFVPASDPLQPPLTEFTSPTIVQISTGNPLPAPVVLTAAFPDPAGPIDQLERVEGMRVSVPSMTVAAPTQGNVNEPNATATSNGVFFGTVTGVPRPFREPGIQSPDPAPSGSIPPIPRWDANPELLRVDSDGIGAPVLDVSTSAVITNVVGPLDYGFRRYTILPESAPTVAGGSTPTAAAVPEVSEITIASYNLERFFDSVNDPAIGEPVLTPAAFDRRLNKASQGIRNFLHFPDIVGIVEVENLTTLQSLAARINADAAANSQPNPQYTAYLVEGNDVGGIDVGFLVKTSEVSVGMPRVEVVEVQQELAGTLFVNPDSSTELLNDRPPLRLNAIVHSANGGSFPLTVINSHLRSLIDVESIDPGSAGWATSGDRVRAKRQAQAEDLADLVQARQTADPTERIMLIGDFNAFQFNDGFGDSMGVIGGTPAPDNETVVPGDGVDLVNPDLDNLFDTEPAAERYSFVFEGNAQSLDHVLVNQALLDSATSVRLDHARINADFPQTSRNSTGVERLSDHDPAIAYISLVPPTAIDDTYNTDEDTPLNVAAPGVLDNDTGNVDDTLTAILVTGPGNAASFNLNSDGSFSYTPAADFIGPDSFTYKVSDGTLESNVATVNINVIAINDAPTITGMAVPRQQTAAGTVSVIAAISDVDNTSGSLSVITTSVPVGITVTGITNNNDGTISASVAAGCTAALGSNLIGLQVSDPGGEMGTGTLTVNVTAETTPPVIGTIANVAVSVPSNVTSTAVTFPLPTATDNCGGTVTVETDPLSGSMFNVGTTTVNVKATDQAGNMSFSSFTVTVTQQYQFSWFSYSGLLLNQQALNQATAGSDIPIRFSLSGFKGANPYSSPPVSQRINCSTGASIGPIQVIQSRGGVVNYNAMFDFYSTTWITQAAWKGTCRKLTISLNDSTTRSLDFYFK